MNTFVLRNPEVAAMLKRPTAPNFGDEPLPPCEKCGKALDEAFITTGGPQGDPTVWRDHPIAVDGWVCADCFVFRYPRKVTPEHVNAILAEGVSHGRAGRFADAEQCFARLVWDWPSYPAGHLNYAEATRSRLHDSKDLDDATRRRLEARMIEQYEEGVAGHEGVPPSEDAGLHVARALLAIAEHAVKNRAFDRARRTFAQFSELRVGDDDDRAREAELRAYVDQRIDLFDAAGQALSPFLDLMGEKKKPIETGEQRKAIANALLDLEEHLKHAPDRWQSAWLYAKGLAAAERPEEAFAAWDKAFARFPDRIDIARDYSNDLLLAGRAEHALEVSRSIKERHPDNATLWCNLAVTQMLCGDIEAAKASIARSLELDPADPVAKTVDRRLARGAPFPSTLGALERGS